MTRPPDFACNIDLPKAWIPEGPELVVEGWVYPGAGAEFRDIRAAVDGRVTLGIPGLDRADVQAAFGGSVAALRSGFRIRPKVWSGARTLRLDYLDATGQWHPFFETALDTSRMANIPKPPKILPTRLVFETLGELYRHFHHESLGRTCDAADAILAEVCTANSNTEPDAGFTGYLENPGHWINARYDKFRITGWVFAPQREIRHLTASIGPLTENRMIYGKERPDVAAHFPNNPESIRSNFYGLVDIKPDTASPGVLRVFAHFPDGTKQLAFTRRMYLSRRDDLTGPVLIYRPERFYKCVWALLRGALTGKFKIERWSDCWKEVQRLRQHLAGTLGRGEAAPLPETIVRRRDQDPYTRWCWHNRLTPRLADVLRKDAAALTARPLISIIVPAYNTPERYLHELLECLKNQYYPHWELCIADDASPKPHVRRILEEAAKADPRIKPVFRAENGHISKASNSALEIATGDFVALLDHDDLLPPDALLHVAEAIQRHPTAGFLYTDEDKIDDHGRRFDPHFKGGWSPEMALTHNYVHHLSVIRRDVVEKAGRFRPEFNGAQDIDLFLRCFEHVAASDVIHVPFVCYHWRAHAESTAQRGDQKGYLFAAARNAIAEAVKRRGLRAEPFLPEFAQHFSLCLHQLKWDPAILRENPVTIVIPSKNQAALLARCLDSLARTTPRESVKVVVVDDASDEPEALVLLASLPTRTDLRCEVVNAPPVPEGFNYSRLVNLGTARADTPLVLHLNNDVEATTPGWLEDLAGWMSVPGVAVVGAKLLYPNGTVNHAGISLGREDGLAHVLFEKSPADELGYFFLPHAARNVAAVTGAALMTRTDLYRRLGGFDEKDFKVAYNDVDYCLRCQAEGLRVVISPQAVLTHVGSASRGKSYTENEHVAFIERHAGYRDPYHSEALDFPPHHLPINPYHHRYARTPRPFTVLVVTHNLNFEGAPIIAWDLAKFFARQPGVSVRVVSPQEGPLRARFAEVGLPLEVWDILPLTQAQNPEAFAAALKEFARLHDFAGVDLIVGNTLQSFWAVHLAALLGKSSTLYVHESIPVKKFFSASLAPAMLPLAEETLRLATRVIFTAQATRVIHEEHNHNDNFRLVAGWVDMERIDAFVAAHDPRVLRRKHGLPEDATLVMNIGSVCERKGQHIYVRAIDQLNRELPALFPGKRIEFLVVGGRESLYQEALVQDIELLGLKNVRIVPETPHNFDYLRLADMMVCTSFEESFPRVLLEGMAFRLPIVSTDVHGIPEMLVNNDEAYLIPAGNPFMLADTLKKALADHFAGRKKMTSMAYAHATRSFREDKLLPIHLQVCREAYLG
jgi:GT2 family glycosyltransferase